MDILNVQKMVGFPHEQQVVTVLPLDGTVKVIGALFHADKQHPDAGKYPGYVYVKLQEEHGDSAGRLPFKPATAKAAGKQQHWLSNCVAAAAAGHDCIQDAEPSDQTAAAAADIIPSSTAAGVSKSSTRRRSSDCCCARLTSAHRAAARCGS